MSFRAPRRKRVGEGWQIIYIDLLTNLMVFFVLLWAINAREQKGIDDRLGDQTVRMVNLPGDVLFSPGASELTSEGKGILGKLFVDPSGNILRFETSGLTRRQLVIHGHTDGDGPKDDNLELGYRRAFAAYQEIKKYGEELPDNVVICTHADNSPAEELPAFAGVLSPLESQAVREAKAKNRRITIEDQLKSLNKEARP